MGKNVSPPDLAFRLYRGGEKWPFIDRTMLQLPADAGEGELPGDWIGWEGKIAVALLSTYPAEGTICGIQMEDGDIMMFLRIAFNKVGKGFVFDPPTAYKFAFRHVFADPANRYIIIELPESNIQENDYLASLHIHPRCTLAHQQNGLAMNLYIIERNWDRNL